MQPLDFNLIYSRVVELDELYVDAKNNLQIHSLVTNKLKNKTFTIKNV